MEQMGKGFRLDGNNDGNNVGTPLAAIKRAHRVGGGRWPRLARLMASCLLAAALAERGWAQGEQYEAGRRWRACEATWEMQGDLAARIEATARLNRAVQAFFQLRLREAGRELDAARFALSPEVARSPFVYWAESLYLQPETRLVDAKRETLPFTLTEFYSAANGIRPQDARLRVYWRRVTGSNAEAQVSRAEEFKLTAWPLQDQFNVKGLGEGDYLLRYELRLNQKLLATGELMISLVSQAASRIDKLQTATNALTASNPHTETARLLAQMLQKLWQKQPLETDLPATRLLGDAEAALMATGTLTTPFGGTRTGQFWLSLVAGAPTPVRLYAPAAGKNGQPRPLVIAMHGAGGSENMFFDAYGNGSIVRLCEERGWLLIAPRGMPGFTPERAAALIEAVDKLYPVDRQRVFLIGHSMGAAQAVASAQATPNRFAGVVALGGGGTIKETPGLEAIPFLVGVGTQDFAYKNARQLAVALKQAGAKTVRLREYQEIEHLFIVQVALPDAFAFFDQISQGSTVNKAP